MGLTTSHATANAGAEISSSAPQTQITILQWYKEQVKMQLDLRGGSQAWRLDQW